MNCKGKPFFSAFKEKTSPYFTSCIHSSEGK